MASQKSNMAHAIKNLLLPMELSAELLMDDAKRIGIAPIQENIQFIFRGIEEIKKVVEKEQTVGEYGGEK